MLGFTLCMCKKISTYLPTAPPLCKQVRLNRQ